MYIDDMLIIGSNSEIIRATNAWSTSKFDMKDMGLAYVILGIKISKSKNDLVLTQDHYVNKILEKFNKNDTNVAETPIDVNLNLTKKY